MIVLAHTRSSTREELEDAAKTVDKLELHWAVGAGDLLQRLAELPAATLVLIERDAEPQLPRLVRRLQTRFPQAEVVLLCPDTCEMVRGELEALHVDRIDRSLSPREILQALQRLLERLQFQLSSGIRGRSKEVHEILQMIQQVGPMNIPVLITGPSGSGKELVARALFSVGSRSERPFIIINVGALAESLMESELFGHEKGAFTGAIARKAGVFEQAHSGTLFLDEVGEMSPNMQVRLLRALESGEITPVGSTRMQTVDVRIIAATNLNLEDAVRKGDFREDLYYRLKVVHIHVPALVQRREDLPVLIDLFLHAAAKQYGITVSEISEGAMRALKAYSWPGNIRELRNVLAGMAVLAKGSRIEETDLPDNLLQPDPHSHLPIATHQSHQEAEREIILQSLLALRHDLQEVLQLLRQPGSTHQSSGVVLEPRPFDPREAPSLKRSEQELIKGALQASAGNRRRAAEQLGIAERTLYRKIKEFGI